MSVPAETTEARTDDTTVIDDKPVVKAEAPPAKLSKREFVAQHVADRAAKDGVTAPVATPAETKSETPADDKSGKPEVDPKVEKKEETTETKPYTPEELERELESKDIRDLDPKRIPPELKKLVAKLQAAEGQKHKKLNDQLAAVDRRLAELEKLGAAQKPNEAKPEEEVDDGTSLLSKDEIKEIYKSPAGKQALAETLEELGFSRVDAKEAADARLFRDALATVKAEDERLQDDAFFDDTVKAINADEKLSAIAKKDNITGAEIRDIFTTAANRVDRARIAKEREAISVEREKERKELEAEREKLAKKAKEETNRTTPSSKAAGSRQPAIGAGEKLSVRDFVTQYAANRKA